MSYGLRPAPRSSGPSNLILVIVGVLIAYLSTELFLFKSILSHLTPGYFHHMIRELQVLGQSSKEDLLPKPGYLALFGDSHAQGKGDWFIDNGYDRNSRYHSGHLLQDALKRDVISFGRSGAGSIDGFVLEPLQTLRFLRKHGLDITDPGSALLYFYEGNDLQNNLDFVHVWAPKIIPGQDPRSPQGLRALIDAMAESQAKGEIRQLHDRPLFGNLLLRLTRNTLQNTFTRKYIDVESPKPAGKTTQCLINGHLEYLPDGLQAPPLTLSQEEREQGVAILAAALDYARQTFKDSRLTLVYLPSPLATYRLVSPTVAADEENKYGIFPSSEVAAQSETLCQKVRETAAKANIDFIDARPGLREAAQKMLIHGPRDWDHVNKRGYEALVKTIQAGLD